MSIDTINREDPDRLPHYIRWRRSDISREDRIERYNIEHLQEWDKQTRGIPPFRVSPGTVFKVVPPYGNALARVWIMVPDQVVDGMPFSGPTNVDKNGTRILDASIPCMIPYGLATTNAPAEPPGMKTIDRAFSDHTAPELKTKVDILRARMRMERLFQWQQIAEILPWMTVWPRTWDITAIPPFLGVDVRFLVDTKASQFSVYLDVRNATGIFPSEGFWEVYDIQKRGTERCAMRDVATLLKILMDGIS